MLLLTRKKIKKAIDFFSKPYDLLNDNRIKLLLVWEGLFIFLLFLLLSPFGIVIWTDFTQFKLIFLFCISGTIIAAMHIYLFQILP